MFDQILIAYDGSEVHSGLSMRDQSGPSVKHNALCGQC
jgi:hypothetical protein